MTVTGVDVDRDLAVVLGYLLRRKIRQTELLQALKMSKSTYFEQRKTGKLTQPNNLINAADAFGLNAVDLLVRYAHVRAEAVSECAAQWG
ncbi:hypothetical protein ACFV6Y_39080 [Streptomyces massasporeus]|uniref:hypothetical protein n=1 Tax=Streptomyces massasporeus TaxID=67324 RepID=UPI003666582A